MPIIFRYQLNQAPAASVDGSGVVQHDVEAQYSDDDGETWAAVPNHHKTISIPSAEVETVMDMPDSTGPQRAAKNTAYKDLMVSRRNYQPVAYVWPSTSDWSLSGLGTYMTAYAAALTEFNAINSAASTEAGRVNTYITVTLSQTYPAPFNLQ